MGIYIESVKDGKVERQIPDFKQNKIRHKETPNFVGYMLLVLSGFNNERYEDKVLYFVVIWTLFMRQIWKSKKVQHFLFNNSLL